MGKKVSFPYAVVASPGAEDFVTIATVPPGKIFHAKLFHINFPIDTGGLLDIALYYGNLKVYPAEGFMTGDNTTFVDEIDVRYHSQDPIRIYYRNRDTAAEKKCYLKVEGELE